MKNTGFLRMAAVFGIFCVVVSAGAAPSNQPNIVTPSPSYPPAAFKAKVGGSGVCQVFFDGIGRVRSATMSRTTGSKLLDENTVDYARKNWIGRPYSRILVPITYQPTGPAKGAKIMVVVTASLPPYPYQARASGIQGSGVLKVSFDEKGKLTGVEMAKSIGSNLLDANTVEFVRGNWYSSGGRKTMMLVPITYQLR